MAFAKELCNLSAGGGNDAVVNGKLRASGNNGCRRTGSDVSHGEAPVDGLCDPSPRPPSQGDGPCRVGGPATGTGTLRVSPHDPP